MRSTLFILLFTNEKKQNKLCMSLNFRQSDTKLFSLYPSNGLSSNNHHSKTPLKRHNLSLFSPLTVLPVSYHVCRNVCYRKLRRFTEGLRVQYRKLHGVVLLRSFLCVTLIVTNAPKYVFQLLPVLLLVLRLCYQRQRLPLRPSWLLNLIVTVLRNSYHIALVGFQ